MVDRREIWDCVEVERRWLGFELAHECLGSGVIDGEDGGGLRKSNGTSLMEKPSLMALRRKASLVLIGIFAYLLRTPTALRFL